MNKKPVTFLQLIILFMMTLFPFTSTAEMTEIIFEAPIALDHEAIEMMPAILEEDPVTHEINPSEKKALDSDYTYKPNKHKTMLEQNQDYTGWIRIPGTQVDYPFVKAKDNDYYLKRDFFGRYDDKGTIYMDHRNIGFQFSNHVILYGHNMRDGSMFGELDLFKAADFALDNDIIAIDDLYGTRYFKIYASYFDDADVSYIQTNISPSDIDAFIDQQLDRSDIDYDLIPTDKDRLLTLITCSYEVDDGRFYVHGKEISYVPHP